MRTRSVDRHRATDYLKKAAECRNSMQRSYDEREWNSCVINAIHCAIAAADALCVWNKGIRHAGERHDDAVRLLLEINPGDKKIRNAVKHLQGLLKIKSDAEYGENLMLDNDAVMAKKAAERLFVFAESRICK